MRLVVTTPTAVIADVETVRALRAEDDTGTFGVRPGHTAFLTTLAISVISWRDDTGAEGHVAVRGGVLRVSNGDLVQVATREAIAGIDLEALEASVIERFREEEESEHQARSTVARLELSTISHIRRYLQPEAGRHRASPEAASNGLEASGRSP